LQRTLYDIRMEFWGKLYHQWISEEFLSFPWFVALAVLFISYLILAKFIDKKRLKDLLLFGSLIAVAAALVDIIGVTMGLWEYTIHFLPISPSLFPFDYTIVPVLYVFVLQYSTSWKNYIVYSLLADGFNCFIINPLYIYLGILKYHRFNIFYMFLSIFIITTLLKLIYDWIGKVQRKNSDDRVEY
jgi:hypothetical protein